MPPRGRSPGAHRPSASPACSRGGRSAPAGPNHARGGTPGPAGRQRWNSYVRVLGGPIDGAHRHTHAVQRQACRRGRGDGGRRMQCSAEMRMPHRRDVCFCTPGTFSRPFRRPERRVCATQRRELALARARGERRSREGKRTGFMPASGSGKCHESGRSCRAI
ncbi:hypothetical protein MPTK1_2g07730 [Marchantia polymorpha subsp. ruderalis]|uniref:Uncharacterized protein n=1 Tax=Marchantia polymorpha TaxID=3197 RepID=A0A2R6XGN0_MARPO|nr:hypothetical protein MARPO_0015s0059 [Marchantia polymorpha]BBN01484.1 hypothetical protein Mp_2g07730 [Marchantia polymorpha subsp. ruderalis]|eukprot:PTQ45251.1 hypothetical protein MARPO_0015s0059 [Marchantia polymorpha]